MTTAIDLVRNFRHLRALVIGDAMLDTHLEGSASRLCSEGPVPVVRKTSEYRIPGRAANTAANLRALDAEVLFLSAIGRDIAGSVLRSALCERSISDRWLVEDEENATLHKLRILADGQYVVRFDEGGERPCSPACQQKLLAHLEHAYALCDLVILSDYRYGVASDAVIARLQQLHEANPKVLVIDSKELARFSRLRATMVTPNYLEACLLVGQTPTSRLSTEHLSEFEEIARYMLSLLHTEQVAITLAEHGVFLMDRQGNGVHLPAHPVTQAYDVGAGDSFTSALGLALASGGTREEAAQIGIDAASIAITKRWTAVVQHQELLQRVSVREYALSAQMVSSGHVSQQAHAQHAQQSLVHLLARLEKERTAGHKIVFTNGVFDILHAGHMHFLRQAKALGDILVVGINSDSSTRRLKGSGRPINSERDRMALVAALDAVDAVILFDEDTPTQVIRLLRPDIHVKGGDYADEALPEAEAVHEIGGQVVILPLAGSMSTSSIIQHIAALAMEQPHGHVSQPVGAGEDGLRGPLPLIQQQASSGRDVRSSVTKQQEGQA